MACLDSNDNAIWERNELSDHPQVTGLSEFGFQQLLMYRFLSFQSIHFANLGSQIVFR